MRWTMLLPLLGLVAVVLTGACAPAAVPQTPPTIRYGEDMCDGCGMIISEPTYAAGYHTTTGETRRFDDIGEMMNYHREHQEGVAAFWVHDRDTREWIRAETAYFVISPYLHTPMGYGVAAFATESVARDQASQLTGHVLTFEELLKYPYLRPMGDMHAGH